MQSRLPFDDVAWEQSDNVYDEWRTKLLKPENLTEIALFVAKYHLGTPVEVRTPLTGKVMFPEEKVRNEVAIMRVLAGWGHLLSWSTLIMTDISDALNTPEIPYEERPILDPSIDEEKLQKLYWQISDVLLQLSTLSFPRIGSLIQGDEEDTWSVAGRPLTSNMNEIVQLGTLPRSKLPDKSATFETSSSYLTTLANLHLRHLTHQRNDAIDSASDCRRKYIARYLFRKLSLKGRLSHPQHNSGPFKLWCDDLRPANMLINSNLELVAVIDWEFTYSAPVEFSHAPPWWLLIEQPEFWPDGIDEWVTAYEPRLQTFLAVLREREDAFIQEGRLEDQQRLSVPMQERWESGDFWVVYAARKSFAFDAIFWKYLDARFFGPMAGLDGDGWERRAGLLDEEEIMEIDSFVDRKVDELKNRVLAWEPEERLGQVTPE
ncbi:hypothetical protein V502_00626 [Pseudogymnoascus sp. VKM F-4520 (FW-2644)]|nr:hypothetical protein V502_00626 [Pseudogymnoascus sp. VKM F-4520 (FW-2644)]